MTRPLILTLGFGRDDQRFFDRQRHAHYPADRNQVPAHLTLFHALPGEEMEAIVTTLATLARHQAPIPFRVPKIANFGNGCAYVVEAPALIALHERLQSLWAYCLTPQDARPLSPHVTIAARLPRAAAQTLLARLRAGFAPWRGTARRLDLWHYDNGPWQAATSFDLEGHP